MKLHRAALILAALTFSVGACGKSGPSRGEITASLRARVQSHGSTAILREPILNPKAVQKFYEARGFKPAWQGDRAEQAVKAIREIEQDGLTPLDYHLSALERLLEERKKATNSKLEGDIDALVTDAVITMVDHVRYGRVRPASLNPKWNMDPRENAPPLEKEAERIAASGSVGEAIDAAKPNHFIYRGLVRALAQLREISAKGGWPTVRSGKPIKPGTSDPRIPAIRARLAVSGEAGPATKSAIYDSGLKKAVELFQARHRLDPNGIIDKDTIDAMNVSATDRAGQVRVNLERARWVLAGLGDEFVLVNLPAFKAYVIRGGSNVWEGRTQIGEEAKQTPSFSATMKTVVFNPDWTVPPMIIAEEVTEGMQKDSNWLASKGIVVLDKDNQEVDPGSVDWGNAAAEGYTLRQPPGPENPLGRVKFLFPNKYSIYLHDTPSQTKFEAERRTFSHGCIRLENALDLAKLLLSGQDSWSSGKIDEVVESGKTENVELAHPLPVIIVYWTVSVGASGEIRYMRDIYDLDQVVLNALNAPPRGR